MSNLGLGQGGKPQSRLSCCRLPQARTGAIPSLPGLGSFPGAATLPWHPRVLLAGAVTAREEAARTFQNGNISPCVLGLFLGLFFFFLPPPPPALKTLFSAACGQGEVEHVR